MHLYAAYLGGPVVGGRMGEDHEVVMIVADDRDQAYSKAKAKWSGSGRSHVDALQRIEMVDGFRIELVPAGAGDRTELHGYNE
jgi:hypothetical protein